MKRIFGRDFLPDVRDRRFAMPRLKSRRRSRTWRTGPTQDQLDQPACVGFAWFHWFLCQPIRQYPIAPLGIYRFAQFFDEWEGVDYEGTSVRGAAKALTHSGHIGEYRWAFSIEALIDHVLERGPVVLGTNWYAGMSDPNDESLIRPTGELEGGHAYLCHGVDLRRGRAKLQNSWGGYYGNSGKVAIALDDLEVLLDQDGEACTATELKVGLAA